MIMQRVYRRPCILLAGGEGKRMGSDIPKQYINVLGRTVIGRTIQTIKKWDSLDSVVIVADESYREQLDKIVPASISTTEYAFLGYVDPGTSRQLSIKNAMLYLKEYMTEDAVVMIHDAVRPEVSRTLFERCDAAIGKGDGVMPYLEMKDTVYMCDAEKHITGNIERSRLVAGQTPEFFNYYKYLAALEQLSDDELMNVCGSTQVAVDAGMNIYLVSGEESNFKITTKEDLQRFKKAIEERLLSYDGVGSAPGK